MGLRIRGQTSTKFKSIATLIAVFALVAQPLHGLVASQVANAGTESSADADVTAFTASFKTDAGSEDANDVPTGYIGIALATTYKNMANVDSFTATVNRVDENNKDIDPVVKKARGGLLANGINNKSDGTVSTPIVIEQGNYNEFKSSSYRPAPAVWTKNTSPTSVDLLIEFSDSTRTIKKHVDLGDREHSNVIPGPVYREDGDGNAAEYFETIQKAIKDSDGEINNHTPVGGSLPANYGKTVAGDTIVVTPDTYNENFEIDKKLHLKGSGASRTIIASSATSPDYMIRLNKNAASGTKISGFTLQNEAPNKPVLKLAKGAELSNLYVTGNHFKSSNKHLIYADKVSDSNFTSNTFHVDGIANPLSKKNAGVYFGLSSDRNTFKNNRFTGTMDSLAFGVHGDNNHFLDNKFGSLSSSYEKVVEVKGSNNTAVGNVFGTNQVVINPAGEFRGIYNEISQAINAAEVGDTLVAQPGTYKENVVLTKKVNLKGVNNPTVVNKSSGYTVEVKSGAASESSVTGFTIKNTGSKAAFKTAVSDISGLEVNDNTLTAGPGGHALYTAGLKDSNFTDNTFNALDSTPQALAFVGGSASSGAVSSGVNFTGNTFEGDIGNHLAFGSEARDSSFSGNNFSSIFAPGKNKLVEFAKPLTADASNGGNVYPEGQNWKAINPGTAQFKGVYRSNEVASHSSDGDSILPVNTLPAPAELSIKAKPGGEVIATGDATKSDEVTVSWDSVADADHYVYKIWNDISGRDYKGKAAAWKTNVNDTWRSGGFGQGEGTYSIAIAAVASDGSTSDFSDTYAVTYDRTKPTINSVQLSTNFINKGDVDSGNLPEVTISADDGTNGSGFDRIQYEILDAADAKEKSVGWQTVDNGIATKLDDEVKNLDNGTYTLIARAIDKADNKRNVPIDSALAASFTIDKIAPGDPTAKFIPGSNKSQKIELKSADSSATIYYTTDGTAPTADSSEYTGAFKIEPSVAPSVTIIKAIAIDKAGNSSSILTVNGPEITNEASKKATNSAITLIWDTDAPATSRVVYGTVSHSTINTSVGGSYGYAFSTTENPTKTKEHSVTITGLTPGTRYYFRIVSHGSPETVSGEITGLTRVPSKAKSKTPIYRVGLTPAGSNVASTLANTPIFTLPADDTDDGEVLGDRDDNSGFVQTTAVDGDVLGDTSDKSDGWKLLGLAWYWWALTAVAVMILGGMLIASVNRRRNKEI